MIHIILDQIRLDIIDPTLGKLKTKTQDHSKKQFFKMHFFLRLRSCIYEPGPIAEPSTGQYMSADVTTHPVINVIQLFGIQDELWESNHVIDCICLTGVGQGPWREGCIQYCIKRFILSEICKDQCWINIHCQLLRLISL